MLHKKCAGYDWFTGVGIVPAGDGLGLRVTAMHAPGHDQIPQTYYGYPVEVVVIEKLLPRSKP